MAFSISCSSRQTYTEETINGTRHIHNIGPLWETEEKVTLEFIRKIGDLNTTDERYEFYRPSDVAVEDERNVLILDSGNYRVNKYNKDGRYLNPFGK